jgi:hypothetical protein
VRGRSVVWALGAAALVPVPAALADGVVYPVGGELRLSRQPPLVSVVPPFAETVYHGRLTSRQLVLADVDPQGVVQRLRVRQRLTVSGVGDYAFTVPGPIADVVSLPGSGGEPGLRPSGILWTGFSSGDRVLAAEARIRRPGFGALPLRIRVERTAAGRVLVVRNVTPVAATIRSGAADPAVLARALDGARSSLRTGGTPTAAVPVRGDVRTQQVTVAARLAVQVQVGSRTVRRVLGGPGEAMTLRVPLRGRAVVVAAPVRSQDPLRPPGHAASWSAVTRRLGADATIRLATMQALQDARTAQWQAFLANPDPLGRSTAAYRYRLVQAQPRITSRPVPGKGGGDRTAVILALLLLPVAAVGLAVAWAHA